MSDDEFLGESSSSKRGKRRMVITSNDEASSTDSSSSNIRRPRVKVQRRLREFATSESSSDDEVIQPARTKKKMVIPESSNSDNDSGESVIAARLSKRLRPIESTDYETDSDASTDNDAQGGNNPNNGEWSDSSDGNSEKCPICLLSFKTQEIGSPETCDHTFCVDCIKEWSKNVNTCPVDRQEFTLILVRRELNGRIIRRVPVEQKKTEEETVVDITYCEVCGQSDREDRMLLCDGCDLGYHLECLDPPLAEVPIDEWYCSECSNAGPLADTVDIYEGEVDGLYEELEEMGGLQPRRRRLLPRTRQSERVRTNVETQRREAAREQPSTSSGFESLPDNQQGPSSSRASRTTTTRKRTTITTRKSRKKYRRRRTKPLEYELDEDGGKFALRKVKKRKRKVKKRKTRRTVRPKTTKKRLATSLNLYKDQKSEATVPSGGISMQRFQAGIPTLHLFREPDQLDFFSDNDDDDSVLPGSVGLLTRARPAAAVSFRIHNRIKSIGMPTPLVASTPCDILGSILDSQSKFLARDSQLSVDEHGTVLVNNQNSEGRVETKKSETITSENNNVNVQSSSGERTSQAPMYPGYGGNSGSGNRPSYGFNNRGGSSGNNNSYRGGGNYGSSSNFYGNSPNRGGGRGGNTFEGPRTTTLNEYMDYLYRGSPHSRGNSSFQRGRGSPRFPTPRRPPPMNNNITPCNNITPPINNDFRSPPPTHQFQYQGGSTPHYNNQMHRVPEELDLSSHSTRNVQDNEISRSSEPIPDTSNQEEYEEEDLDIYSDIETNKQEEPSTNEVGSSAPLLAPPIPPVLPGLDFGSDSEAEQSDNEELVIDTEKANYDPAEPSADTDSEPDAVASTSNDPSSSRIIGPQLPEDLQKMAIEEATVSTVQPRIVHLHPRTTEPESDDEGGCPNMSIYSKSSAISSIELPEEKPEESDSEDCPNFSIYSATSMSVAKVSEEEPIPESSIEPDSVQNDEVESSTKDFPLPQPPPLPTIPEVQEEPDSAVEEPDSVENESEEPDSNNMDAHISDSSQEDNSDNENQSEEISTTTQKNEPKSEKKLIKIDENLKKDLDRKPTSSSMRILQLYDDSDFEEWGENNSPKPKEETASTSGEANSVMPEIETLTEAVSEEERCYTPCMDEKKDRDDDADELEKHPGIGGLDTEMVSEDEKNDFDESQEIKTGSDNEALEINAKDHEMDLAARPEDYEEGEIVEAAKKKAALSSTPSQQLPSAATPGTPLQKSTTPPSETPTRKVPETAASTEPVEISDAEDDGKRDRRRKGAAFKKVSKNTKDRNYRDRSKSRDRKIGNKDGKDRDKKIKGKKKEKKKELERYDVRNIIGQRAMKDKFGRDENRNRSPSNERFKRRRESWSRSRSVSRRRSGTPRRRKSTPRRSLTPRRRRSFSRRHTRSPSRHRTASRHRSALKRSLTRSRSYTPPRLDKARNKRASISRSRSYSPYRPKSSRRSRSHHDRPKNRRKSRSPPRKNTRHRKSRSKSKERVRKDKNKVNKKKKKKSPSPKLSLSASPQTTRNPDNPSWIQGNTDTRHRYRRDWTPSWSRSPSPVRTQQRTAPIQTWTPPIHYTDTGLQSPKLTVYLRNNEAIRKKKEKKKKAEKRVTKDRLPAATKKRRRDRTPPPSKEVFASGDNILVSVSFKPPNETDAGTPPIREVMTGKRKRDMDSDPKKNKKEKVSKTKKTEKKKKKKDTSNIKPVAIIDLDKSPFKELTPSPRDVIVLTDSENGEKEAELMERQEMLREELMEMGQEEQDSVPQSPSLDFATGPKTPPEPQIKFLIQKPAQLIRNVQNPLHDEQEDAQEELDPQEELELRLNEVMHKGPNTPPEPPSSPPSSPDAYDPFEPTKSRSPSPEVEPTQPVTQTAETIVSESTEPAADSAQPGIDGAEVIAATETTGDNSNTEPDSEDRVEATAEKTVNGTAGMELSQIGVVINRQVQPTPAPAIVKPMVSSQPAGYSATSGVQTGVAARQSVFTTASGGNNVRSTPAVRQGIVLPTAATNKTSPTKSGKNPIKSTPIKPMQQKTIVSKLPLPNTKPYVPTKKKSNNTRPNNGIEIIDVDLDFDSPYSPGSSDFEDLFEPPMSASKKSKPAPAWNNNTQKSMKKPANAFDSLFGGSPVYKPTAIAKKTKEKKVPVKYDKKPKGAAGKLMGVKMDEDSLKILDDLPSSAVELQVKDKFLKKLNRQERVVEEVKLVLKPHYNKKHVTKEQYKDILRRAVPKICHNKSGEINPQKIQSLINAYVKKARSINKKNKVIGGPPGISAARATLNNQTKPAKTTFWS